MLNAHAQNHMSTIPIVTLLLLWNNKWMNEWMYTWMDVWIDG